MMDISGLGWTTLTRSFFFNHKQRTRHGGCREATDVARDDAQMAGRKTPKKRGRPTLYTPEIADKILIDLADGKSLRKICKSKSMPHDRTVRGWVVDDVNGFSPRYARARAMGLDAIAEEILEISDSPLIGVRSKSGIKGGERFEEEAEGDNVQRSDLMVESRKWLLARLARAVYGDKGNDEGAGDENSKIAGFETVPYAD